MKELKNYEDVLKYMMDQLPMFQRVGNVAYKKDLTNVIALCESIGNPHLLLKTVHIAGTNGKGTTTHLIAGGLQAQGYKVGVYTSPHYKDFRERIKINGTYISKAYIMGFINKNKTTLERIKPSFFEMTVALAFKYFADKKVDYAIIETGLGGLLDSTNIITPILSLITNISYDHQDILGDTLPLIATQKAGIIKPSRPIIIGETQQEVRKVFVNAAAEAQSVIYFAEDHITLGTNDDDSYNFKIDDIPWLQDVQFDIAGPFQEKNLLSALFTLYKLKEYITIDDQKMINFFRQVSYHTKYMGRWQVLSLEPYIFADSAHNEGGLTYVMEYLSKFDETKIHFVLGFVNDKDLTKVLSMFPKSSKYYWAKANIPRGLEAEVLKKQGCKATLKGKAYGSVRKAYAAAKMSAKPDDIIYVGGSIFVVAEVI